MKNIYLLFICLVLVSCGHVMIDGYMRVCMPFFMDAVIYKDIAHEKELKMAVKSNQKCVLSIDNVDVKKGSMTLFGKNGTLTFYPNKKVCFKLKNFEYWNISSFVCINYTNSLFSKRYTPPNIHLDGRYSFPNTLDLFYKFENNYWLISIPIKKSDDFKGTGGQLISHTNPCEI